MSLHDEQEHELYGGEIPEEQEGEMDTEEYQVHGGEDGDAAGDEELEQGSRAKELEEMKRRIKEIEKEAELLRLRQAKAEKDVASGQDPANDINSAEKEEVDLRSIYVGNVHYACTPEELQQHFESCGTVSRVTILTDKFGQPKGFAYVEFVEVEAVQNSLILNESDLHGRQIKVSAKRTNVPGMRQFRGRRPFRPMRGFIMAGPPLYPPYVYGRVPRYRRAKHYRPY